MNRLLNIQTGEGRLVFLLFAEMFLLGIGFNFVETSVFPLFLSEFDAGTLPYLYIINGITVALLTTLYLRLGRRLTFSRQLVGLATFVVVLVLLFWLALTLGGGRPVTFALPILFQIVVNMSQIGFWTMAARLLTLRQSKRLFGPIGGGMWVAIVLTGFLIPLIVRAIGTVNLLLVSAAGFAGALALLVYITRTYGTVLDMVQVPGSTAAASEKSANTLLRSPYILMMFGLTIVAWLSFYFIDNIFFNRLSDQFPTQAEQSSFLGLYLAALGIFTLINNAFLTGFVVNRYGVRVALFVLPISLFVVTLVFSTVGALAGIIPLLFWLATVNRILDLGLLFSVDQTAQAILYQPLPATDRTRIQTIDSGIVRMVAVGLAGALLILLNRVLAFDVVQLGFVLLFIIIAWLAIVFLTSRAYPQALAATLTRRRLTGVSLSLDDSVTTGILKEFLSNPRPSLALYALGLLADNRPDALTEALPQLLAHPAQAVRLETLRRLESIGMESDRVRLTAEGDPDPLVRGAAWRVLAATRGPGMEARLLDHLESDELPVRLGVLVGLRRYSGSQARAQANEVVATLAGSADPAERLMAVQVLADSGGSDDCALIKPLLQDPDDRVSREALVVAGRLACPEHGPVIIEGLNRGEVRTAAIGALVASGESVLSIVSATMERPDISSKLDTDLVRVCGRIGGDNASNILLNRIDHPDDSLRTEVLTALSQAGYRAADPQSAQAIRRQINVEAGHAAWLLAGWRDCLPSTELAYLCRVLEKQFEAARERTFLLVSCLIGRETIMEVRESLQKEKRPTQAKRSYALELLDLKLQSDLKNLVMPLAEDLPPSERLKRLGGPFNMPSLSAADRIEALMAGDDRTNRWLRISAVHGAGIMRISAPGVTRMLFDYQHSTDPLLADTALWALERINGKNISDSPISGERRMLSTIEKVIILKDVELFAETPDELLAEVAGLLTEIEAVPGQIIFSKGETGDSLYIVVSGNVRVHDADYTINILGESEVFGEMALLDPEPRMASATAESDTLLLRLDQEPFYELMDIRSEVARGIIRVMSNRLRMRVQEVAAWSSGVTPAQG